MEIVAIHLSYCSVRLIFSQHCRENVLFSEPYVGFLKMKTCISKAFLQQQDNIFLTIIENNSLSETNVFEYLFEFSSNNSRINCKICSKLTIETPDVVLVYLLLTSNIFDTCQIHLASVTHMTHCSSVFLLTLNI